MPMYATDRRTLLVTSALPYANGAIHLGHLVEYIQTDIWVRFQKMRGHQCWYVCADDTHGTPIMLRAEQDGITPELLISRVHAEHQADFDGFHIGFDNYHTTHSPESRELVETVFRRLEAAGLIEVREIEQFYDTVKGMFLPDRFIKGECPKCHTRDQYGDNCEACGASYAPTDLINPYSAVSGAIPVTKQSAHYFFKLGACAEFLKTWTRADHHLQPEAANKLDEWLTGELSDWDISRDAPYFGFEIPGAPGKYFYVWLDAPVGYMGSFKHLCATAGLEFDQFWSHGSNAELYHFIGKDILYFHALFWPAMLEYAGFRTPTAVFAHGFLTVNGEKMSKSRGTFITARSYLDAGLNPEWLRYYFAAKLSSRIEDIDLNLEDFSARVNSDLVGKYVNIASRTQGFIHKFFDGRLANTLDDPWSIARLESEADTLLAEPAAAGARDAAQHLGKELLEADLLGVLQDAGADLAVAYEQREFSKAMRAIMELADLCNDYVQRLAPWDLARDLEQHRGRIHVGCSIALNAFRLLTLYLKPVLPDLAVQAEAFLNIPPLTWADGEALLTAHPIRPYTHLLTRVDPKQIEALIAANRGTLNVALPTVSETPEATSAALITIDEFAKVDLRVGCIVKAETVPGADKLLRLTVDLGVETRQIFAGIRTAYPDPAELEGRLAVVVTNLAPRKMKFGVSEGMMLAAGPGGQEIFLLSPDAGARPGMQVK